MFESLAWQPAATPRTHNVPRRAILTIAALSISEHFLDGG